MFLRIGDDLKLHDKQITSEDNTTKRITQVLDVHSSGPKIFVYYEFMINDIGLNSEVCIGFAQNSIALSKMYPGFNESTWGLTTNGALYLGRSDTPKIIHGISFGVGDVIGCGVYGKIVFWTKNGGLILRTMLEARDKSFLYPTLGFKGYSSGVLDLEAAEKMNFEIEELEDYANDKDIHTYFTYVTDLYRALLQRKTKIFKKLKLNNDTRLQLSSYYQQDDCTLFFKALLEYHQEKSDEMLSIITLLLSINSTSSEDLLNLNAQDSRYEFALFYVCKRGWADILDLMLQDTNIDVAMWSNSGTSLHAVAREGKINLCEKLIGQIPINSQLHANEATPLYCASADNQTAVMKYLLEKDADPNLTNIKGQTPLHIALERHNYEAATLLIDRTRLDIVDKDGNTIVHVAGALENEDLGNSLVTPKTQNARNNAGYAPIHVAAQFNNLTLVKLLLDKGVNVDEPTDLSEWTALHFAAKLGHEVLCTLLVEHHADVNYKSISNETPLSLAMKSGNQNCVDLLINSGAEQNNNVEIDKEIFSSKKSIKLDVGREKISGLLYKLVPVKNHDDEFQTQFLLTFPFFLTPSDLLTFLMDRFNDPKELQNFANSKDGDNNGRIIRNRIRIKALQVINEWVAFYKEDFDDEIIRRLFTFLMNTALDFTEFRSVATEGIKLLTRHLENEAPTNIKNTHAFHASMQIKSRNPGISKFSTLSKRSKKKGGSLLFDEYTIEEIAQTITMDQFRLFQKITPRVLLSKAKTGSSKAMKVMIDYGNNLAQKLVYELLQGRDMRTRSSYFNTIIEIGELLRSYNNIYGYALCQFALVSLYINKKVIPQKDFEYRENIDLVTDNGKRFIDMLAVAQPPVIPFLAPLDKTLLFLVEGNTIREEENGIELINFRTLKLIAEQLLAYSKNHFRHSTDYDYDFDLPDGPKHQFLQVVSTEMLKERLQEIKQFEE